MTETNTNRFLDAFSELEKSLRRKLGEQKGLSFVGMVERAASKDSAVGRLQDDLKELADLRNAIVHERFDGHPIAEPYSDTVVWIERLVRLINTPPHVDLIANAAVETCTPDDKVGAAAAQMFDGAFSQLPVIDDGTIVALLTSETIARWVGSSLRDGVGLIEETTVQEVLDFTEDPSHHWKLLARSRSVFDALAQFDRFSEHGWSLDALLVTEHGSANDTILGILTTFDIPKLHGFITA